MQYKLLFSLTMSVGAAVGAAAWVRTTFRPQEEERPARAWKPLPARSTNSGPDDAADLAVQCSSDRESGVIANVTWHQNYATSIGIQWAYADDSGNDLGVGDPEVIDVPGTGSYDVPLQLPDVGGQGYRIVRFVVAAGLAAGGSVVQESDCHLYVDGEDVSEVSTGQWASNSAIAEGVEE